MCYDGVYNIQWLCTAALQNVKKLSIHRKGTIFSCCTPPSICSNRTKTRNTTSDIWKMHVVFPFPTPPSLRLLLQLGLKEVKKMSAFDFVTIIMIFCASLLKETL